MTVLKHCGSSHHVGARDVPIEEFGNQRGTVDSKAVICKQCARQYQRSRRIDPVKYAASKESSRAYYSRNKASYDHRAKVTQSKTDGYITKMVAQARCRARNKGIVFDITSADIVIPVVCPVLGIPLVLGGGRSTKESCPSIDRVDSSKGYTKDNITIVSWRANKLKSNATLTELKLLYEYYASLKGE